MAGRWPTWTESWRAASRLWRQFTDWSAATVGANYLVFGYAEVLEGRLVLRGWLYNLAQPTPAAAQALARTYFGSLDEEGSKKVARDFAADILAQVGAIGLGGSKIYFVSDRTGNKEIWSMDYDGSNPKRLTSYNSITGYPAVSADGRLFAFTTWSVWLMT